MSAPGCRMAPEVILAMDEGVYDGKVGLHSSVVSVVLMYTEYCIECPQEC